jgi:hypothetical protein
VLAKSFLTLPRRKSFGLFMFKADFGSSAARMSRVTVWKFDEAAYTRIKSAKLALKLADVLEKIDDTGNVGKGSRAGGVRLWSAA